MIFHKSFLKITRNEDKENINVDNYIFQSALNKKCEKYYQQKLCLETEATAAVKQHGQIMLTESPCIETEKSYIAN
jgi:hypothetical protein